MKSKPIRLFALLSLFATIISGCCTQKANCPAAAASSNDKMEWFDEARFGMFIHWGIYSVPAGEWNGQNGYGEWFQLETGMPADQYGKFATQFDPMKFDADAWVKTAKDAGMKYIVITAKHHDGFCMYDTKLTDYNVVQATPWHHDPMKDLAAACKKEGLKFDFYYSIPDWHNPDFPAQDSQHHFHGDPNPNADLEKYDAYMQGQLRELLTNYGPIGILWFDDGGSFEGMDGAQRAKLIHAQDIIDEIHQLQPKCIINNRLGLPADYGTPEQHIPGGQASTAFEVCMTLNNHWGYNKSDQNWKSSKVVIQNLADIASKGGNYLLNVGPTSEGILPPPAVKILGEVGQWMHVNGDAIYGTTASPLAQQPSWGRVTQEKNLLYLHVFNWPQDGKLQIEGIKTPVKKAWLLADSRKESLPVVADDNGLTISVASQPLDSSDTVIVLRLGK